MSYRPYTVGVKSDRVRLWSAPRSVSTVEEKICTDPEPSYCPGRCQGCTVVHTYHTAPVSSTMLVSMSESETVDAWSQG